MRAEQIKSPLVETSVARASARAPQWVMPLVKTLLLVADGVIATTSYCLAYYLREGGALLQKTTVGNLAWAPRFAPYGALLLFVILIRVLALRYYDLYRLRGEFSFFDDGVRVFKATAIGSLLIVAAAFLYRGGFHFRAFSYARSVFVLDFLIALASLYSIRLLIRSAQTFFRLRGINLIPTLVVGRGPEAAFCIRQMRERPSLGYRVIGAVDLLGAEAAAVYEGVPVISDLAGLPEAIRESGANEVIIADANVDGDALFEVMMRCGKRGIEFRIAPSLFNCLPSKTEVDQIGALPMVRLFREPLSDFARGTKRTSDIIIAALTLALFSPFWLLISLLIKFDSKGPILYAQERVGMDGRIFVVYKFRTMRTDADSEIHREYQRKFIAGHAEANVGDDEKPAAPAPAQAQDRGPLVKDPLSVSVRLDRVLFKNDLSFRNVSGSISFAGNDRITGFALDALSPSDAKIKGGFSVENNVRSLTLDADDAGTFIKTFTGFTSISGGSLSTQVSFPAAAGPRAVDYTGTVTLSDVVVTEQPFLARLFAAGSLDGPLRLLQGEGIRITRLTAPFTSQGRVVMFHEGRASGPSVGGTFEGMLDRRTDQIGLTGTMVPAYGINSMLGAVPILGDILASRKGEGVFGVTYSMKGPLDDPTLTVNPLSVLTPGILRRIFEFRAPEAPPQEAEEQPQASAP